MGYTRTFALTMSCIRTLGQLKSILPHIKQTQSIGSVYPSQWKVSKSYIAWKMDWPVSQGMWCQSAEGKRRD